MGQICATLMKTAMEMDIAIWEIVFAYPITTMCRIVHIMDVSNIHIFVLITISKKASKQISDV